MRVLALLEERIKEIIFIAKFLYKWQVLASIGKMSDIRGAPSQHSWTEAMNPLVPPSGAWDGSSNEPEMRLLLALHVSRWNSLLVLED